MSFNYTGAAAGLTTIAGVAIAGSLYVSTRLVLDLISKNKTSGKTHPDDVENNTASKTKGSLTVVRAVALAAAVCAIVSNILLVVGQWHLGPSSEEYMAHYTAVNFFSTAETALVFITALLASGKFTASSPMSFLRVIQYVFIVFIGLFATILFIMGAVQSYVRSAYDDLWRAYPNLSHAYLALLAVTTFVIAVSLFKRISHASRVGISSAERCALYPFTSATVPVLTGQVVLGIVSRVDPSVRGTSAIFNNTDGYLAYTYISAIFYIWGDILILEFARQAAKRLSAN
ncbi:hypothetical protein QBC40DRAFT_175428 [Triangularia verruculosa]|uniref:Transmembrane protein n=1 Tax=Triangularia verruculosa TaxID=2587418 RepID=A0AAN6XFW6_9PEZI|nr:hypothetical protein QBC40DRAFT_175428 [Triangularia verruculosa]